MSNCGIETLDHLVRQFIPHLEANIDVSNYISTLKIKDGETLATFMTRYSNVDTTIHDSGVQVGPNVVLQRILDQLKQCPDVSNYIFPAVKSFNGHIAYLPNVDFKQHATAFILSTLRNTGADMSMRLRLPNQQRRLQWQTQFSNHRNNPGSQNTGFDFPQQRVIEADYQSQEYDIDKHMQADNQINKATEPQDKPNDPIIEQLTLLTMCEENAPIVMAIDTSSGKPRCSICDQAHLTINCYLLYRENMPKVLLHRIAQACVWLGPQIEAKKAEEARNGGGDGGVEQPKRPPYPWHPYIPTTTAKFGKPELSSISAEQRQAFAKSQSDEQAQLHMPHVPTQTTE